MMREAIKQIVEAGGFVEFPYKTKMKDFIGNAIILNMKIYHVMLPDGNDRDFESLDDAVEAYMSSVFTKRNIALAFRGIKDRGMANREILNDIPEIDLRKLVREYNDKYFALDYPFAGKHRKTNR